MPGRLGQHDTTTVYSERTLVRNRSSMELTTQWGIIVSKTPSHADREGIWEVSSAVGQRGSNTIEH